MAAYQKLLDVDLPLSKLRGAGNNAEMTQDSIAVRVVSYLYKKVSPVSVLLGSACIHWPSANGWKLYHCDTVTPSSLVERNAAMHQRPILFFA